VHPRAEIERGLREIARGQGGLSLDQDIFGGYAYVLMLRKR
jgi:hypothetical protein